MQGDRKFSLTINESNGQFEVFLSWERDSTYVRRQTKRTWESLNVAQPGVHF